MALITPPRRTIQVNLPSGQYYFRVPDQADIVSCVAQTSASPGTGTSTGGSGGNPTGGGGGSLPPTTPVSSGSTIITYTAQSAKTLRRTYESHVLPRARYDIRVRKVNVPVDDMHVQDTYLNEVAEIQNSHVSMSSLSTGWFVIQMSDQISGIPNITWKVKGVKVDIYDKSGNVTATQWSNNPADIVLDMLIGSRRGALRGKLQIDFPAFVAWRDHCTAEGLAFNGVFEDVSTLWDSCAQVFKVGRAYPVRVGSKLSVAVDKPATPAMLFGPGNIIKDTFNISYLSLQDRANEFEVSYYDKDDYNKKKTIRIADPTAAQSGQVPKTAQYELFGIDNFTQAQKEVWYQLYQNRLARRIITFDAPIEAIALNLGDVAYIQHDMMNWGTAGRLAAGNSTTNVTLDKEVTIESGKTYKLLLIHDKIQKSTCTLGAHTTKTVSLTGLTTGLTPSACKRLVTNVGDEAAILDFSYTSGTTATVVLDRIITGSTAIIWDVEVVEERTVTTGVGTTTSITVSSAFSQTPNKYCNYMFGESTLLKKPYRLLGIRGDGIERRTLTFGEYNEAVYQAPENTIPAPSANPSRYPSHVTNLLFTTELIRSGDTLAHGMISWNSSGVYKYAGADIYVAEGTNGEYVFEKTVFNTNACALDVQQGAQLRIKVVAFNETGTRANALNAPVVGYNVLTGSTPTQPPTGGGSVTEHVRYKGTALITWTRQSTVTRVSRVQLRLQGETEWQDFGTTTTTQYRFSELPFGTHTARVRAEKGLVAVSDWLEIPVVVSLTNLDNPDNFGISHTLNTDGSSNIVLTWDWDGEVKNIDGFQIITYQSSTSTPYVLHSDVNAETVQLVDPTTKAFQLHGVPADKFYTFFVRAFTWVDTSGDNTGISVNPSTTPAFTGYQPSNSVAFQGDVTGYINGKPVSELTAAIEGISNDNVLSANEKRTNLVNSANILQRGYERLSSRATAHSLDVTTLNTAKTLWDNLLDSYEPKWNNIRADTTIFVSASSPSTLENDWFANPYLGVVAQDGYLLGGTGPLGNFELLLDFRNGSYTDLTTAYSLTTFPGYTFARTGQIIVMDNDGTLDTFSANVAPVNGNGYRTTTALTNYFTRSREVDFNDNRLISFTSNTTAFLDGTTSADTITASAGAGFHTSAAISSSGLTIGQTYTSSCFIKKGNHRYVAIHDGSGTNAWVLFDLQAGTILNYSSCVGYIVDHGGWWRLVMVLTTVATSLSLFRTFATSTWTLASSSYTASGTETMVLGDCTLYAGNFPNGGPVIITSGGTASVGASDMHLTHSIAATDMVLTAALTFTDVATSTQYIASFNNSSANNAINFWRDSTYIYATIKSGGTTTCQFKIAQSGIGRVVIGLRRNAGVWSMITRIGATTTITSTVDTGANNVSIPTGINRVDIGQMYGATGQSNGYVETVLIKPGIIDNTALTTFVNGL